MNKISFLALAGAISVGCNTANADEYLRFQSEILKGLDIISAQSTVETVPDEAPGELGADVYQYVGAVKNDDIQLFIPTSMYLRAGAGLNMGFATDKAIYNGTEYESSGSYTTQIGLGWNLSSFVRAELDFQESTFNFSDLDNMTATYQTIGGTLYFDFVKRYVQTGDITRRRHFIPFMGIGAGVGQYEFQGTDGANGIVIAAPRGILGINVMFNDLIGIDVYWQYQMMIGDGFGWNTNDSGITNINNVMAAFRVNF